MELKHEKDYEIYWKDRLKARFRSYLPYRCGVIIGYQWEDSSYDVADIFKKYLLRTKSIPDMSSGKMVKHNGEIYYYIECHLPFLWKGLYSGDWRVNNFVTLLRERFKEE